MLILALTGAAQVSRAETVTVTMLGTPTGVNDGHDYVTPYEVALGTFPNSTLQLVTCYDVLDEVSIGDVWQANLSTLGAAVASGYFSGRTNALAGYEEIAWLSSQTYSNPDQEIALQHAIWDVFGTAPPDQNSAQDTDLAAYVTAAQTAASDNYSGFDFSSTVFLEEVGGVPGQPSTEQAFVYQSSSAQSIATGASLPGAPEPGTLSLLAGGFLCLLVSFGIKRFTRAGPRL